jgi:hypothetical protein
MSFGDLYTVQPGQGNPPGLPPVDLPTVPLRQPRTSLTVTPAPKDSSGIWGGLEEYKAPAPRAEDDAGIWGGLSEHTPEAAAAAKEKAYRDIGAGEAFARTLGSGATFGFEPAIEGVIAAGREGNPDLVNPTIRRLLAEHGLEPTDPIGSLTALFRGLGKLAVGDEESKKAYGKAREEAERAYEEAYKQQPAASYVGEFAGGLMTPLPGMGAPAALGARLARGAAYGAAGGGLSGVGHGVSQGLAPEDVLKQGAESGMWGGALGGPLGAVLGPRLPSKPTTPGERAGQTARDLLGAPLPRGVESDKPFVQATTAKLRQFPLAGERIGERVAKTAEAAGEHIGDIAGGMASRGRAAADIVIRPGLQSAIDANKATIDAGYNALHSKINPTQRHAMPRTQKVLQDIRQERAGAGWVNPSEGLEQFENVSRGATFRNARRARADARNAGSKGEPHKGYDKGDFDNLNSAMTADMRDMAANSALGQPQSQTVVNINGQQVLIRQGPRLPPTAADRAAAVKAFDDADRQFGPLADMNRDLQRWINAPGQGGLETLLGAAMEKGGNVPLLAQLRRTMPPAAFQQIGGTLLAEAGRTSKGDFSLAQFANNWGKISDHAKRVLFDPKHLRDINEITGMAKHIGGALKESTTSHSAGLLVLLDVAKDMIELAVKATEKGGLGAAALTATGVAPALYLTTRWLGNPAVASSAARWNQARIGYLNHPTPGRLAIFNVASRNLSRNTGVPAQRLLERLTAPAGSRAEDDQPEGQRSVPR